MSSFTLTRPYLRRTGQTAGALIALSALAATAACSGPSGNAATTDTVDVTVATNFVQGGWEADALDDYAAAVNEAADGQINFEFNYAESLVKADETAGALQDGLVDLAVLAPVYTPAQFPISNWIAKLGFFGNSDPIEGHLATAAAQNEWAMDSAPLQEEFASQGIHMLASTQSVPGFDLLCADTPVTSLEDANGKRVRVAGEAWAEEATRLGMEPVQLTGAEMYEGFQRGVVDCAIIHAGVYVDSGLWEIADYHISAPFTGWNQYFLVAGDGFWQDLPEWAQEAFDGATAEWMTQAAANFATKNQTFFSEGESTHGIEFLTPDEDFATELDSYHDSLLNGDLQANKPDGISDEDASTLIERRQTLQSEWTDRVADAELGLGTEETWAEWVEEFGAEAPVDLSEWNALINANAAE